MALTEVIAYELDTMDRVADAWDALADRVVAAPFMRAGWIAAWWRAFGRGKLEILTVTRDRRLRAVLPIAHRRFDTVSPTNWHTPEFGVLADDTSARTTLLGDVFSHPSGLVSLSFIHDRDPDLTALIAAAEGARRNVCVRTVERSYAVDIRGDWDSYERSLRAGLRRDLARRERRLAELGPVTLEVTKNAEQLDERLSEAFALENSGWKAQHGTAIACQAKTARFYTEIARWAAAHGWLRLIFLLVNGRPLAFHLALEHAGTHFPLKGGFDQAFAAYSPGQLIVRDTLRRAFAIGLARYEFLGDDAEYKRRWATRTSDRVLLQAFSPTVGGHLFRVACVHGRPLAQRILAACRH